MYCGCIDVHQGYRGLYERLDTNVVAQGNDATTEAVMKFRNLRMCICWMNQCCIGALQACTMDYCLACWLLWP